MLFFDAYYIWFDLAISGLLHHTENMSIESKTAFGTVSVKVIATRQRPMIGISVSKCLMIYRYLTAIPVTLKASPVFEFIFSCK
jgi:hypothetical protein